MDTMVPIWENMREVVTSVMLPERVVMRDPGYADAYRGPTLAAATTSGLQTKVWGILAFAMAFTAVGGFVSSSMGLGQRLALPATIVMFIMSFVITFARNISPLNIILTYAFAFAGGVALDGIISVYVDRGLGGIVFQAAATTVVITLGMAAYGITTRRNLAGIGMYLFFGMLGLVGASIVGMFFGGFGSIFQLVISVGIALISAIYISYQVNQTRYMEDTMGNAIIIAVGLYISIYNLFISLLRILGMFGGGGRSRD